MKSDSFIYEYLKCDRDTGAGSYEKLLDAIKEVDDWETVKQYILKLKYFYYLRTSLWRIISEEIKRRANWKCSCGCRENLQTHHLSYDHHGEEHLYMGDLQVLCSKCHQGGVHKENVSVKEAEKRRNRSNKKEEILSQLSFYPSSVAEGNISGSSFTLTRKLLEELEHEHKIIIERGVYEGWRIRRT